MRLSIISLTVYFKIFCIQMHQSNLTRKMILKLFFARIWFELCTPGLDQGSISSKLYTQLLRAQIPIAQERQSSQQCLFALLGPTWVKSACKMLMLLIKSTPGLDLFQQLNSSFSGVRVQWDGSGAPWVRGGVAVAGRSGFHLNVYRSKKLNRITK